MKNKSNKQLVRDYIEQVINAKDVSGIRQYLSEEYTEVHGQLREQIGPEGAKARIKGYYNTFPDFHVSIEKQIAEGDWVVTCGMISGTHAGVFLNIKPTGKKLEYTGVIVDKVVDGKIVEHGGVVNNFDVLLEAGAIKLVELEQIPK
jgi:predicted ester cyclase